MRWHCLQESGGQIPSRRDPYFRFRLAPVRFRTPDRRCQTPISRFLFQHLRVRTADHRFIPSRRDTSWGGAFMSCALTQQIRAELGGRDGLGHSLPRLPQIASNLHQGHVLRSKADLSCSQIKSILDALRATQVKSSQFTLTRFGMRIYRFRIKIRRFRRAWRRIH